MAHIGSVTEQIITEDSLAHFQTHKHENWYEFLIGLTGVVGVRREGWPDLFIRPGEALFLPKRGYHWMWSADGQQPMAYYNAFFSGDLPVFDHLCSRALTRETAGYTGEPFWWMQEHGQPEGKGDSSARALCLPAKKAYTDVDERRLVLILGFLLEMRAADDRRLAETLSSPITRIPHSENLVRFDDAILGGMRALIEREPQKNHSAAEIAEAYHLEAGYLSRKLKRLTGYSLTGNYYLIKMERAQQHLESGRTVKETAYLLGFKNPYHFSRKFNEVRGRSPSSFRISPLVPPGSES